jgi:hypothetical protein
LQTRRKKGRRQNEWKFSPINGAPARVNGILSPEEFLLGNLPAWIREAAFEKKI